jgi:putative RNA 2'-phosphotransferase
MPTDIELTRLSKMLSLVLRHEPGAIGLVLDASGWADTGELIEKMTGHGYSLTGELLQQVVATSDKKRFSFNEDGTRIRAAQGHSIDVDLQLQAVAPPSYLYHGTGRRAIASILAGGLQKRKRHHVHLSADLATAVKVGRRHGAPKVFVVKAGEMHSDGYSFYLSENGVWLVDEVPPRYLVLLHS